MNDRLLLKALKSEALGRNLNVFPRFSFYGDNPLESATAGRRERSTIEMVHSKEFYQRVLLSAFSRSSAPSLTLSQIKNYTRFAIGHQEMKNVWSILDEMVHEGFFEHNPQTDVYYLRSYKPKKAME